MKLPVFRKRAKIRLGEAYDQGTFEALAEVLEAEGAELLDKNWAVAGSIEISTWKYKIGKENLNVEAETVQGLEISGEKELVERIAEAVRRNLLDNQEDTPDQNPVR